MSSNDELNISLEPHLAESLNEIAHILPENLSSELKPVLAKALQAQTLPTADKPSETAPLISYTLLLSISAWSRSSEAALSLRDHNLSSASYSMVTLLAGTRTSPERKFPAASMSGHLGQTDASRELNDRRAVTAVLNALLSILGSGIAVWWAADRLRWKDEWKVLLALLAATVVAVSEAILYLIWSAHRFRKGNHGLQPPPQKLQRPHIKIEDVGTGETAPESADDKQVSISEVPSILTSSNVQEHQTTGGLRERSSGVRKGRNLKASGGAKEAA